MTHNSNHTRTWAEGLSDADKVDAIIDHHDTARKMAAVVGDLVKDNKLKEDDITIAPIKAIYPEFFGGATLLGRDQGTGSGIDKAMDRNDFTSTNGKMDRGDN